MSILYNPPIPALDAVVPVPEVVQVPITPDSVPFNSVQNMVDPMDLAPFGYVEEEYFVSGKANVYSMGPSRQDNTYIKAADCPYTNRILVRKPANPAAFSGTVLVEISNSAFFMDNAEAGWGAMYPYLMNRGDAWVGLTFRDTPIRSCKRFNPERYAPLSIPNPVPPEKRGVTGRAYHITVDPDCEIGLCFDYMSQVAALCRSGKAGSPFEGYQVKFLYGTGASAGDLTTYAGFVHNHAKQPDGRPVFDGFQIYMTGAPANLNNEEVNPVVPDPRTIIDPVVPTFRVLTMGDILGKGSHPDWGLMQRKEDSDSPVYRIYEMAGAALGIRAEQSVMMNREDAEKVGARWVDKHPKLPYHAYASQYVIRACFDALKKYCESGILPPASRLLETEGEYPDADFVLDEDGNGKGGVRSHFVDVPIATYGWDGKLVPFSKEKLRDRYHTHAEYVKQVAENVDLHVKERLLLPEDAVEILEYALRFNIDDDELMDRITGKTAEGTYGM